jgi:TolA-binding protein
MKRPLALALSVLIATSVVAQTESASPKPKSGRHSSSAPVSKTLEDMKDAISAQQQQIQQLQQQIQSRDQAIQQLQQQVTQAQSTAQQAQETANAAAPKAEDLDKQYLDPLQHDVADLKTVSGNTVNELQETQKRIAGLESPLAIHYKGVTLTPGGFLAAETVWRSHALTADINTPFNTIPYGAASQSKASEFYGSGRQSRVSMLVQGKLASVNATGYYESDFLSAGVTSNNNQSNSYTMRQRQLWGQAAFHNGWTFTGGQMWSLVTETRKGLDNRTEALPSTIDAQYQVGFSWARQYGVRVTKNFSNKVWLGVSVENAEVLLTAHGNSANFLVGAPGTGGGLYNPTANYSWNLTPDYVVKFAFEPGFGHYEVFGVASDFRERIYPGATLTTPTAAGAFNNSVWGGGIGANARWMMVQKKVELGVHYLGGPGVGRYGTSTLPDLTVKPSGALATLHSNQALGTLEFHAKKMDIYTNFGAEFDGRAGYLNSKGKPVGYGSPLFSNAGCETEVVPGGANGFTPGSLANCNGDTRNLMEATVGFWYKPYNGEKGRFQFGPQYSYVIRNTWAGVGGAPNAVENMIFTSFRYYLP